MNVKVLKKLLPLLIVIAILFSFTPGIVAESEEDDARFAGKTWEEVMDEFFAEHGTNPETVACGWCNTVTGEEQYHNGDQYMVSGSMYKVPMNMIFTEKVHNGEITWNTFVGAYRYEYALHATIVDSNNEVARSMWDYLGGYQSYRHLLAPYMGEDPDTVDQKFYENNFSTPRQMIYALKLLATESERFPRLLDEMKQAEPNKYFKERPHDCEIAQKYGYYPDPSGSPVYLNDCAVIYTEEPICVVIFIESRNEQAARTLLKDFCDLMIDYTRYTTAVRLEKERREAEEAAIAALNSPSPSPEVTSSPPSGNEPQSIETPAPVTDEPAENTGTRIGRVFLALVTAGLAVFCLLRALDLNKRGKLKLSGAVAAIILTATALLVCILPSRGPAEKGRDAAAFDGSAPQAVVSAFFDALCEGDYPLAYSFLDRVSTLGLENDPSSSDASALLSAVRDNWDYRLYGECLPVSDGAVQQVVFTTLDLESLRDDVISETQNAVSRLARDLPQDEIYDENGAYRDAFTERAYAEALDAVLSHADDYSVLIGLNIRLVNSDGEWRIVPDSALYAALTGGAVDRREVR